MNCLTARQLLELARPDEPVADDFEIGAAGEASRHVETCPACQTAVRRQNQFDAKVGAMVRDVPVPADLKGRLLARLHTEAPMPVDAPAEIAGSAATVTTESAASPATFVPAPVPGSPPIRSRSSMRRRSIIAGALTAACLVTGIGAWFLWRPAPSINPNEIAAELVKDDFRPDQIPELTKFANGADVRLPSTMNTRRLDLALPIRRLHALDVAVYFFTVSGRNKTMLEGRLAVIPKRDVDPRYLPLATSYLAGPLPEYKGRYCVTSWVEGEFVYVLCLKGASNELDRLVPPNRGAA